MKVDHGMLGKLTRLVGFLIVVAVLVLGVFSQIPLIRKNQRMRQENLRIETELKREEARGEEMQRRIHALNSDPRAVERLARERMGYAKPGETIIFFEPARVGRN